MDEAIQAVADELTRMRQQLARTEQERDEARAALAEAYRRCPSLDPAPGTIEPAAP